MLLKPSLSRGTDGVNAIIGNANYQPGRSVFPREDGIFVRLEMLGTAGLSPADTVSENFLI